MTSLIDGKPPNNQMQKTGAEIHNSAFIHLPASDLERWMEHADVESAVACRSLELWQNLIPAIESADLLLKRHEHR